MEMDWPQMTIGSMCIACCITKARNTLSYFSQLVHFCLLGFDNLITNSKYLLIFECNNGYSNAAQSYVTRNLHVFFISEEKIRILFQSVTFLVLDS